MAFPFSRLPKYQEHFALVQARYRRRSETFIQVAMGRDELTKPSSVSNFLSGKVHSIALTQACKSSPNPRPMTAIVTMINQLIAKVMVHFHLPHLLQHRKCQTLQVKGFRIKLVHVKARLTYKHAETLNLCSEYGEICMR